MPPTKHVRAFLWLQPLLLMLCAQPALSQSTETGATARQVVFTVLPTAEVNPSFPDLYARVANEETPIRPGFGRRGAPVSIPMGTSHLEIYTKVPRPDGQLARVDLAAVDLNAAGQANAQVILLRNPQQPMQFNALVTDDSAEAFPPGTVRFDNLYPGEVAVKLGEERFALPFRDSRQTRVDLDSGGQTRLPFLVAVESESGWEFRKSSQLALWPRTRMQIVCLPYQLENGDNVFRVHYIQDVPKPNPGQ